MPFVSFRSWQLRVRDIIDAANSIQERTNGMTFEEFIDDDMVWKSVLYDFVVIGEATVNIPEEIRDRAPDVPWREMRAMRNVATHEYFQVLLEIVWGTIHNNLPSLVTSLQALLENANTEEEG